MHIQGSDLLLERVYAWEAKTPERVFMTQPETGGGLRTYNWRETVDQARRMAAYLQRQGIERGDRVAIMSKNCAHFVMSDLAIWMAGGISVALYPTLTPETVSYILEHSGSKLLFVGKLDSWELMQEGVPDSLPTVRYPLSPESTRGMPDWDDIVRDVPPIEGRPVRDPSECAIVVYTSGSTGRPKGVAHSFLSLSAPSAGLREVFDIDPNDRYISYLPLAHVFERACVEASGLIQGHQIFFAESLDTFVQDLQRARPTIFISVPRLWQKFQEGVFAKMPQDKLDRLLRIPLLGGFVRKKVLKGLGLENARYAISGSAPIPPELIVWYRKLGLELLEGYGMTENFAYSHCSLPGKSRPGFVGNNLPGVETKIGKNHEVLVKSPSNMMGYYQDEALTAESFTEDGFLKTGDRGEIDPQGRLKITGRVKELFKTSKGKYVAPAPIENMLNAHPFVEQSCVMGAGRTQPVAIVQLAETLRPTAQENEAQITADLEALLAQVNSRVEAFEQLQLIAVAAEDWQVENGFLTPTLKTKRAVIEHVYTPQLDTWSAQGKSVVWAKQSGATVSRVGTTLPPQAMKSPVSDSDHA